MSGFIPPHGGYEDLLSFRKARIVFDGTVRLCDRFLNPRDRTVDQMVQAARSGKQNILEGCMASATSKESEIKLVNVARASLEELLEDLPLGHIATVRACPDGALTDRLPRFHLIIKKKALCPLVTSPPSGLVPTER